MDHNFICWHLKTIVNENFFIITFFFSPPSFAKKLQYVLRCLVLPNYLWPHGLSATSLLCPWDSRSKNTGVMYYFPLQRIFPPQGWHSCLLHLLHWHAGSLPLVPHRKPPKSHISDTADETTHLSHLFLPPLQLMPYFVMELFSTMPGLPGLFVACAFSGTLRLVYW